MTAKKLYRKFWENGYVVIPNFLTKKEINKIFFQLNDIINQSLQGQTEKILKLNNIDQKYLYLKKKDPKLKSHFYDLTRCCDSFVTLAGSKKLLKYAKLFSNSKTIFVEGWQVRADHRSERLNLPEHQELNQLSKDVFTCWIPLVDVEKKSGGLYFRPKTHKLGHVKYKNANLNLYAIKYKNADLSATAACKKRAKILEKLFNQPRFKKFKSIDAKLKAGDAVMFHTFLFHGTHPNLINRMRWSFVARYNSIKNAPYLKDKHAPFRVPYDADYNLI